MTENNFENKNELNINPKETSQKELVVPTSWLNQPYSYGEEDD